MFMGEYQHTIDAKGRLIIPARFREGLGEKFILTKGLDGCLFAYPPQEWAALEKKMRSLPFTKADARAFVRFFFAGACECEVDKQGRILIPGNLREYAGLEKDVVVIGVSSRVEIWSAGRWQSYNNQAAASVEEVAEKIVDFDPGI
ncbi:division/cell wall cluster transcriptional repressor MraZ [Desulfofundulus thermobenzoicus]|uniref:Transcriptional regulator MraZ n=1 Tax=Desulfofundulus thermobenzoicus TaxID=29376 RepID=A0A6N7IQM5_9FIRM|nr:division/cell wall cluster transcriptional repressor MraZ [Desulfofundulus thermobenzoicus]MQL52320.1 division/cell wall cluster transcriptional repressor MraZ [Desulfofundulus thermobenzoicus]HHW43759.1 division/cell wall cluster transcriptional repressor MraZ [Desulfotomaculum sp.]